MVVAGRRPDNGVVTVRLGVYTFPAGGCARPSGVPRPVRRPNRMRQCRRHGAVLSSMTSFESPAVVAYDGSPAARAAVEAGATLFGERGVVVVSVWESGLAMAMATMPAS